MANVPFRFPHIPRLFTATILFLALWAGFGLVLGVNSLSLKERVVPSSSVEEEMVLGTSASESAMLTNQFNYWRTIAEKKPDHRDAFIMASMFAYKLGDRDEAKRLIDHAFTLDPNSPTVLEMQKLLGE